MALDIRGSLKNTKINLNNYIVIDELLSNAIDSYLIRKKAEPLLNGLQVIFSIEFFDKELEGEAYDFKISCTDNGAGLADSQLKAFVTKDTSYKDDLAIEGIGQCKGSGRIQYFHYFSKMSISSTYKTELGYQKRNLNVDDTITKEIDENTFTTESSTEQDNQTTITLDVLKTDVYEKVFAGKNLRQKFSSDALKHHVLVNCMQRLVGLKESIGNFSIIFKTKYKTWTEESSLVTTDLPQITKTKTINIFYKDANNQPTSTSEKFTITHYKLNKSKYRLPRNAVALCAKSSPVKAITKRYLKTGSLENNDVNGFYHIILVESSYLDRRVNEHRDNFDIPTNSGENDLFIENLISFEDIYSDIDDTIIDMVTPPDWDKEKIVKKVSSKYGVSASMIAEAEVRIHYGDTETTVVKRVLDKYQERILKDTSEIFEIREQITKAEPNSEDFREKVNDLAWKYTASLKSIDMAHLSQLIVRRAAIVEVLSLAINQQLAVQEIGEKEKRQDEKIIHNIFFPMRKDSLEVNDHDIWLLNEEYHYYQYIASDMPLSKITWEGQLLFESNIDDEMEKIFQKNEDNNSAKRPDIALFNKEGSAIIIEFKAPGVSMDDHVGDLMEYSQLLAAKSRGRLKKFYGYLIGTNLNPNRMRGYTRFPNGKGWFGTEAVIEHSTSKPLGELYSEVLYYEDIVERANNRLEVYKKRLNVDLS